jgi:hypothetical protein
MVQVTRSGGTGKAEDAKLQDAGISLKQCPGKRVAEKEWPTVPSNNGNQEPDPVVSYAKNGLRAQSRAPVAWLENMNRSSVSRSQQRIASGNCLT